MISRTQRRYKQQNKRIKTPPRWKPYDGYTFLPDIKLLNEVGKIIAVTLERYKKWVTLIKNRTADEGLRSDENVT